MKKIISFLLIFTLLINSTSCSLYIPMDKQTRKTVIDGKGRTYRGDYTIYEDGTTIRNMYIKGDLIISESVGDGSAYFEYITLDGDIIINGGGPNTDYGMDIYPSGNEEAFVLEGLVDYSRHDPINVYVNSSLDTRLFMEYQNDYPSIDITALTPSTIEMDLGFERFDTGAVPTVESTPEPTQSTFEFMQTTDEPTVSSSTSPVELADNEDTGASYSQINITVADGVDTTVRGSVDSINVIDREYVYVPDSITSHMQPDSISTDLNGQGSNEGNSLFSGVLDFFDQTTPAPMGTPEPTPVPEYASSSTVSDATATNMKSENIPSTLGSDDITSLNLENAQVQSVSSDESAENIQVDLDEGSAVSIVESSSKKTEITNESQTPIGNVKTQSNDIDSQLSLQGAFSDVNTAVANTTVASNSQISSLTMNETPLTEQNTEAAVSTISQALDVNNTTIDSLNINSSNNTNISVNDNSSIGSISVSGAESSSDGDESSSESGEVVNTQVANSTTIKSDGDSIVGSVVLDSNAGSLNLNGTFNDVVANGGANISIDGDSIVQTILVDIVGDRYRKEYEEKVAELSELLNPTVDVSIESDISLLPSGVDSERFRNAFQDSLSSGDEPNNALRKALVMEGMDITQEEKQELLNALSSGTIIDILIFSSVSEAYENDRVISPTIICTSSGSLEDSLASAIDISEISGMNPQEIRQILEETIGETIESFFNRLSMADDLQQAFAEALVSGQTVEEAIQETTNIIENIADRSENNSDTSKAAQCLMDALSSGEAVSEALSTVMPDTISTETVQEFTEEVQNSLVDELANGSQVDSLLVASGNVEVKNNSDKPLGNTVVGTRQIVSSLNDGTQMAEANDGGEGASLTIEGEFDNLVVASGSNVSLAAGSHVKNLAVVSNSTTNDGDDLGDSADQITQIDMAEGSNVDFMYTDQAIKTSGYGEVGIFASTNEDYLDASLNSEYSVLIEDDGYGTIIDIILNASDGEFGTSDDDSLILDEFVEEDGIEEAMPDMTQSVSDIVQSFIDDIQDAVYKEEPKLDPDYEPAPTSAPKSEPEPAPTSTSTPEDTTPPTFDDIANQTIDVGVSSVDWKTYIKNESDDSGGTLTKSVVSDGVVYGTSGTYDVTVKVADSSSNETQKSFKVEVSADIEKPTFDAIPDQKIGVEVTDIDWTTYINNAKDNSCGNLIKSEFADDVVYGTSGDYKVTVDVDDPNGNTESQIFEVVVEADNEKPTFNAIANQSIDVGVSNVDWTTFIKNASDNSCGVLTKTEAHDGVIYGTPGTYNVMVDVEDPNKNVSQASFDVVVEADTEKPTFDDIPDQIISTSDSDIDWTTYMQNVSDNSCGKITLTESDGVVYGTPADYTVEVFATDPAGNRTAKNFIVTVQ